MKSRTQLDAIRFWSYVEKTTTCWNWTGATSKGYGLLWMRGRRIRAHRYAWQEKRGPIPDGLQIDHLCRNRRCVKPSHLRVVDQRTNILCGDAPTAQNARKTRCPKGHGYIVRKNGRMGLQRQCLTCRRERELRRYYAKKLAGNTGSQANV
jgi:hypothetical protein